MTKSELVAHLALYRDLPQFVRGLKEGEGITLERKRNARICRNPQTGETFPVDARTVKEIVNK